MKRIIKRCLLAMGVGIISVSAKAQLSTNPDKFLGNITTGWPGSMDTDGFKFLDYWNQLTPENATKWESIEGNKQGKFSWTNADKCYKFAKENNIPFKFHCLVWGSQYPQWVKKLTAEQRYDAIVTWMDAVKERYPDLQLIDVVNEAVEGHQKDTHYMKEALGGGGETGYDWIIKAFEMAYERWPDAILIYNDFNTFQWNTDQFIDLVKTLRDAGAPIDAYGCQSHDMLSLDGNNVAPTFKSAMDKMHKELMMPMYSSEYDVGTDNDNLQLKAYKEQIPYMWEADYCAGITLWGWIYGKTWTTNGNSGLIKKKEERPALEWLREYMQSDAAKNAKSPFPGQVKEASVYIKPESLKAHQGEALPIKVSVRLKTKTIEKVEMYVNDKPVALGTTENVPQPGDTQIYEASYTPSKTGKHTIKAVVTATDGTTYERLSGFKASKSTSIQTINSDVTPSEVYTLQGVKVGNSSQWDALPRGIYIVNGHKKIKK